MVLLSSLARRCISFIRLSISISTTATPGGRELLKYFNDPHTHIHITVKRLSGEFGNTWARHINNPTGQERLLTADIIRNKKLRETLSEFIGSAILGPGKNYFLNIDLDEIYGRQEQQTDASETIFHEIYAHIHMREQGVPFRDQHFEFAGTFNGQRSIFYNMDPEGFNAKPLYDKYFNHLNSFNFNFSMLVNPLIFNYNVSGGGNRAKIEYYDIVNPRDF